MFCHRRITQLSDGKIAYITGGEYIYREHHIRLLSIDNDLVHGVAQIIGSSIIQEVLLYQLRPIVADSSSLIQTSILRDTITTVTEAEWEKARYRLEVITPLLTGVVNQKLWEERAQKYKVSIASLYRWKNRYLQAGSLIGLLDSNRKGPVGNRRLSPKVEKIIQQTIETHYLTKQRRRPKVIVDLIRERCLNAQLPLPSGNAIRLRLLDVSPELAVTKRKGRAAAQAQFSTIKGSFPGIKAPLDVVQLDHTLVDVMLVDEEYRMPLNRPWLTVATDVFSRMIVGFYLSFETPGAAGTGICLANAILPKELLLSKIGVEGEWPCWGVMKAIHTDNAKEFVGSTLQRACEAYNIKRLRRLPKKPYLGGHVERVIKTFMQEVHQLPGTTFSNSKERGEYNSVDTAAMTLREFEYWFSLFVINIYHRRIHSSLNQSPFERYREGLLGSTRFPNAPGVPPRLTNEQQVRLDFMPGIERTVQREGVVIGHIHYNADILRPYITGNDGSLYPADHSRKLLFKRDPRDISVIYFLDPLTKQYYPIPYRNTGNPAMSAWEHRQILSKLREQGRQQIPEALIIATKQKMSEQVAESVVKTKKGRLTKKTYRFTAQNTNVAVTSVPISIIPIPYPVEQSEVVLEEETNTLPTGFTGFADLDDDAFAPEDRPVTGAANHSQD